LAKLSDYLKLARHAAGKIFDSAKAELPKAAAKAPEFTCKAHDGTTVRLRDYRGRKVVLWFYPKADTPG
jgi:peroxiredoxin